MAEMQSSEAVSTKLRRIAENAARMRGTALTSLSHHIDVEWLREAFRCTRRNGAVGVDGQTWRDYERDLERNLHDLLNRFKSGRYVAPPVRRVHIPKGDGRTRPIGIPTLEDKVLQRAVAMALSAVYEQDFLDCSYGFRPDRSAHMALGKVRDTMMQMWRGWLIEVDIQSFFDTIDHRRLREILERRVRDGVILRTIGKWLNAGVLEGTELSHPDQGTPQGGVISPLLANIYLHEVLDRWIEDEVKPKGRGSVVLVRYADDFVILCRSEQDAKELYAKLPERFAAYNLKLHPEKTRLLPFDQPKRTGPKEHMSFDFLGFTHAWMKSRKGIWVVFQVTSRKRLTRSLTAVRAWLRQHLHDPIARQHRGLCAKLLGHFAYFGLPGNAVRLQSFREEVRREWKRFLSRRSRKGRLFWDRYRALLERYPLPYGHVGPASVRSAAKP
jgi:group II intron reverse transcriptase/maturase